MNAFLNRSLYKLVQTILMNVYLVNYYLQMFINNEKQFKNKK
jgi:hypothetical protein